MCFGKQHIEGLDFFFLLQRGLIARSEKISRIQNCWLAASSTVTFFIQHSKQTNRWRVARKLDFVSSVDLVLLPNVLSPVS